MNLLEGARRIRFVGKTAVHSGSFVMLFSVVGMFALRHTRLAPHLVRAENMVWIAAASGLSLAIVGFLLRILAYVLEGFGLPRTR